MCWFSRSWCILVNIPSKLISDSVIDSISSAVSCNSEMPTANWKLQYKCHTVALFTIVSESIYAHQLVFGSRTQVCICQECLVLFQSYCTSFTTKQICCSLHCEGLYCTVTYQSIPQECFQKCQWVNIDGITYIMSLNLRLVCLFGTYRSNNYET